MKILTTTLVLTVATLLPLTEAEPARAEDKAEITPELVFSDAVDAVAALPSFKWLDSGKLLVYDSRVARSSRTFELYDPESGLREPALDMPRALRSLGALLREMDTLSVLPWPDVCDGKAKSAAYEFDGDVFLLDIPSSSFRRITESKSEEAEIRFSPDGQYVSFIRDNDLYLYDVGKNTEQRLTTTGSDTLLNGTLPWLYWEEIFSRENQGYWWSGDSKCIAFLQTNQARVDTMHFVTFENFHPILKNQFYSRAGEINPYVRLGILTVGSQEIVWADLPEDSVEYIVNIIWMPSNAKLVVETVDRAQENLRLFLVDKTTGAAQEVLKETDSAWVDPVLPYFFSDEKHFLGLSKRDGLAHLYQYSCDGNSVGRIACDSLAVMPTLSFSANGQTEQFAVDELHEWVYFTAAKELGVERHLYRAKLDSDSLEMLTRDAGSHEVTFSPDFLYYTDVFSSLSTPPSLSVYRNDGTHVSTLAPSRVELLAPYEMKYPELLRFPASDGLQLPAMVSKPADFDSTRKYPVILFVYGGQATPIVVDKWRKRESFSAQILLRKGYLLASFDNRSSAVTSESQSARIKGDLWGKVELADLLAFVNWLKKQPFVDSERLGICGWSGGGTYTLLAMTHSSEFKAGIAGAPVTDWHYYDTKYTEAYMRRPVDNPDGYRSTSLLRTAADLHGRLLMMHGVADDNVHIQNTWDFVDSLIAAGKTLEMMIYPSEKHGCEDRKAKIHCLKTEIEFWERNL